jgi:hypothetical protein
MTLKVALTDVAWWHRIGLSGNGRVRNWGAFFSDPAKQVSFWDMAMRDELQHNGGEVELKQDRRQDSEGRPQGEAGTSQGLHDSKGKHFQPCSRRSELDSRPNCRYAGQAALSFKAHNGIA